MRRGVMAAAIVVMILVVAGTVALLLNNWDDDEAPPRATTATIDDSVPTEPPLLDAAEALEGTDPGDPAAVEAFLDSEEGRPLTAIPDEAPAATCNSDLAALVEPDLIAASTAVPDRWLNEAALAVATGAQRVIESCEEGDSDPAAVDMLDRSVELYVARLDQMGVER